MYKDTVYFDISNSRVKEITADALTALRRIDKIYLQSNQLTTLPLLFCRNELQFYYIEYPQQPVDMQL